MSLGWDLFLFRSTSSNTAVTTSGVSPSLTAVATWSTDLRGIDWLIKASSQHRQAKKLGGDGYRYRFAVRAGLAASHLQKQGITSSIGAVPRTEWLLVEAWDRS